MRMTTLCYLERDGRYLMLHRTKKAVDDSHDKWIGVGGKFEPDESPEECMLREVREETGLVVTRWRYHGIVTFVSDVAQSDYMHLFSATEWEGTLHPCDEGELQWIPKNELGRSPLGRMRAACRRRSGTKFMCSVLTAPSFSALSHVSRR